MRKEFEDLKEQTKKAENDLEEQIRQVDNQARSGIEVVGQQVEEKAKVAHTRYQGLSKHFFRFFCGMCQGSWLVVSCTKL